MHKFDQFFITLEKGKEGKERCTHLRVWVTWVWSAVVYQVFLTWRHLKLFYLRER